MRCLVTTCSLLVVLACAAWATAGPPLPLDRPTPPPCAADGKCYPNVYEWGYYPGRWRRWPGHELVPTPAKPTPAERLDSDLSPTEIPSPETEDAQAPPASTKKIEDTQPTADVRGPVQEAEDADRPSVPPFRPTSPGLDRSPPSLDSSPPGFDSIPGLEPSSPGLEPSPPSLDPSPPGFESSPLFDSSPLDEPAGPTTDLDPPPALPFAVSPTNRPPAAIRSSAPVRSRLNAVGGASPNDPPPTLPSVYRSASL